MCIDEFNGDNFDHGPLGFFGGGYLGQVQTNGRPMEDGRGAARHAHLGKQAVALSRPDAGMMRSGEAIYAVQCAACHAPDGSGVDGLFPILKGSALVQS